MALYFDPLTATLSDLQSGMKQGKFDSVYLVNTYLAQIQKHNDYLHAVLSLAPLSLLLEQAKALDTERVTGKTRGPLHGIPILVKDNIATHPDLGMDTTAGSYALCGSRPKRHADLVDRLISAGAIIIGKANLSEFSYYKGKGLLCGWSAVGGQTQSAYVHGGIVKDDSIGGHSNPGGSSSGSAVAVSAGFAPVSIGTETGGSLIMPGGRAALYTIKPTIGIISGRGIVPISDVCDSAGPFAKTVEDLAILLDVLVDPVTTEIPKGGYTSSLSTSWSSLRIGFLEPSSWKYSSSLVKYDEGATNQMNKEAEAAYTVIEGLAKASHRNISLITKAELTMENRVPEEALRELWTGDFKRNIELYLSDLETSQVRTLEEIIEFNEKHADKELPPDNPSQEILLEATTHVFTVADREKYMAKIRDVGRTRGIDYTLDKYNIDVIIGPAESDLPALAAASAYPIATLPLGYLDLNGRPFALAAITKAHGEAVLVGVMAAWEKTFGPRRVPSLLT